jgi:hypothetical protein
MLKRLVALVALLPAVACAKAVDLDAATRADVRCVVALSREAGEAGAESPKIPELKSIASYYIWRIESRTPKLDFDAAFEQEGMQMSHADYLRLPQLCRNEYGRRFDAPPTTTQLVPK